MLPFGDEVRFHSNSNESTDFVYDRCVCVYFQLQKVTRTSLEDFDIEVVTSVTFASMIEPSPSAIGSGVTIALRKLSAIYSCIGG